MYQTIQLKAILPPLRTSIDRSPLRHGFLLIPLALAWFALAPRAQALAPPPDGGYPGDNTAEGTRALFSLTTGVANTALGFEALYSNRNGGPNTATGAFALHQNIDGANNVATGYNALYSNTSGSDNTATGLDALLNNTSGSDNTATGFLALFNNNDQDNTAVGFKALFSNSSTGGFSDGFTGGQRVGQENTAIGSQALYSETSSRQNTAIGSHAMYKYNGGFILPGYDGHNTAIGSYTLYNVDSNGIWNIALGADAGLNIVEGNYNIDIGNQGDGGDYNTIRIGTPPQPYFAWVSGQSRTFIAGIRGVTTDNDDGIPVVIDSAGQLGTTSSSARFKEAIKPMDKASEAILALKPVTFHYKSHKSDSTGRSQFGLIAEEVAKVNPDLVVRDAKGEIYTVRYEAVNAMLLNEFLKEHREVQEQKATISQLKSTVTKQDATAAHQQKQIEALTAGLQKVSAQLEASKPAPQVVNNP